MATNKLTAPQVRILVSILHTKAHKALEQAEETYKANMEKNKKIKQDIVDKVWAKHKRAILSTIRLDYGFGYRSAGPEFDEDALGAFSKDVAAALHEMKAQFRGSEGYAHVAFPALGLADEYRGGRPLRVPANEADKWRALSKKIDTAFLDGSAINLLELIEAL